MKEVEKWLEKAEKDLSAAEINLQEGLYEVSAFLSHQAAEKALKALYILKFKRLWKIHDLRELSIAIDADPEMVEICKNLNPHYLATRYPLEIEYDEERATEAFENSKTVLKWVKEKIKKK